MARASYKKPKLDGILYKQREKTGDVTFIVESERICAHRCVLAANSEKYEAQFYGPNPDQGEIQVNGVTAAAFKQFLKLFYFDNVFFSIEHIGDVLDLAKQSLNDDFVNDCIEFLIQRMKIDTVSSIYQVAIAYDIEDLTDLCEEKICTDAELLFGTKDFIHCDRAIFERILQLDSLMCSEGKVFDACISWAWADCDKNKIDGSNKANLRTALGDAIAHIRFGSMKIEELDIRYKTHEGFFSEDEYNEITKIIAKLDGFKSEKFNQTRRFQTHGLLECKRISKHLKSVAFDECDEVSFRCDKPIRLHGFVIASNVINELTTSILIMPSGKKVEKLSKPEISIKKLKNETIIFFIEPVKIVPVKWHIIHYESTDLKGRTFQRHYPNGQVESNDILFLFKTLTNKRQSLVSRLLFVTA